MKLYHGTTVENVVNIAMEGLRRGTFLTTNESFAQGYAANQAVKKHGDKPAVVVFDADPKDVTFVGKGREFYGSWYVASAKKPLRFVDSYPVLMWKPSVLEGMLRK